MTAGAMSASKISRSPRLRRRAGVGARGVWGDDGGAVFGDGEPMTPKITFKKLAEHLLRRSTYEVFADGASIGFVWSKRGFSYRGTQGWNSGIRIRDFHPTEWYYGKTLDAERSCYNRSWGVRALLELA